MKIHTAGTLVTVAITAGLLVVQPGSAIIGHDDDGRDADGCPIHLFCVAPADAPQTIRYSVLNVSDRPLVIRRHGLPFRMNLSGATHLVVLRDGTPCVMDSNFEIGIPMLSDLAPIKLKPGEALSGSASVQTLVGGDAPQGQYEAAGIWRVGVGLDGEQRVISVLVPAFSFVVPAPSG